MINGVLFAHNGLTVTYDDGSVVDLSYQVVNGVFQLIGSITEAQQTELTAFITAIPDSIKAVDPRLVTGDPPLTIDFSGLEVFQESPTDNPYLRGTIQLLANSNPVDGNYLLECGLVTINDPEETPLPLLLFNLAEMQSISGVQDLYQTLNACWFSIGFADGVTDQINMNTGSGGFLAKLVIKMPNGQLVYSDAFNFPEPEE